MQYDLAFAERLVSEVRRGREIGKELVRLGLGQREIQWLCSLDQRALLHDPLKGQRLLHSLITELRASCAIVLAEKRHLHFFDRFFATQHFHTAVQQGRSLAAAFADFLLAAGLRTPVLAEVVRVEATLARCRRALEAAGGVDWRAPPVPGELTHVTRAPGVAVARHSPDALDAIAAVERHLAASGVDPLVALADGAPRVVLAPPTDRPPIPLGFIPGAAGIHLVELDKELYEAIERAGGVTPVEHVGRPLAQSLVEDEVLIAATP